MALNCFEISNPRGTLVQIKPALTVEQKIEILGAESRFDLACGTCGEGRRRVDPYNWIYPAILPDGRVQYMLKTLLSNTCQNNCYYCAQRAGRDFRRVSFTPEEMARLFEMLLQKRRVAGLFLSSGVSGSAGTAMDHLLACAEIIRRRLRFTGYIHLKLLPGSDDSQIKQALYLADRVSVNLEAPTAQHLKVIAPQKDYDRGLLGLILKANEILRGEGNPSFRCRGITTQYVVGAAGESDQHLIESGATLYRTIGAHLKRLYFSAYSPVGHTPLFDKGVPAAPLWREHRLYQADFLLRCYGFAATELVFDRQGMFLEQIDPKKSWALAHPEFFPVEINTAPFQEIVRVPGIGPISAKRILLSRKEGKIGTLEVLQKLGVRVRQASPFILINGRRRPLISKTGQLELPL